jgi:hypothetical protein
VDDPYRTPKSTCAEPAPRKLGRTAAQVAFDRCMIVLASLVLIPMLIRTLAFDSRIPAMILYGITTGWWLRSLIGVVVIWNELDARVLRFGALGVLALGAMGIAALAGNHLVFNFG